MDPDAIALSRELADRSRSEREAYYVQHATPPAIRTEVESLLSLDGVTSDEPADVTSTSVVRGESVRHDVVVTTNQQAISIGRYQTLRLLGRGGMGEVHLARDVVLDRNVAVKLIARDKDDEAGRKRLVREARAAGRLRHPNIVTIFDAGEHDGRSYIAMEYVPGETLRNIIRRQAPLSLRRRLELIEEACAGLAHAHRAGVVHLDIKPDNLMLDESGVLKVLDFGIARVLQSDALATRPLAGTLAYMSPEHIAGKTLDRRSDVFSLGCSAYELLTQAPAFSGSTQQIVMRVTAGPVPRLLDACPDIDRRLDAIIGRAMALDPADRYDDLDELRVELARVRADIDPAEDERFVARSSVDHAVLRRPSAARTLPSLGLLPLAAAIIAVVALATGVGAYLMWGARPPERISAPAPSVRVPAPEPAAPTARSEAASTGAVDEVWRRLASGDRAGVLELLSSVSGGKDGARARLPHDVLATVRTSVLRMRAAIAPATRSTASYRSAEARLARAERLEAQGRPVEAIGAFWQAADLYTHATARGQEQPSRVAAGVNPPAPTTPATPPAAAAQQAPAPIVESTRPEQPPPAGGTETAVPQRSASPQQNSAKTVPDADAILDTIRRYQAAYQALEVSNVVQVFPSLDRDQVEQLRRTFAGLSSYSIEIRNPNVAIDADVATVHALVVRRMIPRVGRPVANEVETQFQLRRTGTTWVITAVKAS
jgi:predicted Ser/Thr protein kinase